MIILEAAKSLDRCHRLDAVEALCLWLDQQLASRLPPDLETIVEAKGGHLLRGGVGEHLVWDRGQPAIDHRVLVAIGPWPEEAEDKEDDWRKDLTTVPHEILHVAKFCQDFGGKTPAEVKQEFGFDRLYDWSRENVEEEDESPEEMEARSLTYAFLAGHPQYRMPPACVTSCGCRPRSGLR